MLEQIRDMNFLALQSRINQVFQQAIVHYALEDLWEYVCQQNTSSSNANYHSTRHMREMTSIAYWLLHREYFSEAFEQKGRIHSYDQSKAMVIACMIHDMNHSLGHEDDDYNINQALKALRTFYHDRPLTIGFLSKSDTMYSQVEDNIRITRFPYSDDKQPQTIYQKCIRDADILYSMQLRADNAVVDCLRLEMGVKHEKYRTCSRHEFIQDRMPFLKTCQMFTQIAADEMSKQIESGAHQLHLEVYAAEADIRTKSWSKN